MNRGIAVIGGIGLGAGLIYLFDPDRGGRRRALIRDRVVAAQHRTNRALGRAARDLNNRTTGIVAEMRGAMRRDEADDDVIVARVASRLGHVVSHPHALGVTAEDGIVVLEGPILAEEVDRLVSTVRKVRGVRGVDNRLDVHEAPGDLPQLQGGVRRTGARIDILQRNWSPATRVLAGTAGGALVAYGIGRGDALGVALGAVGAGLAARSLTNRELVELAHAASVSGAAASKIGRKAAAPFGLAARKLQSFVAPEHEAQRDELH